MRLQIASGQKRRWLIAIASGGVGLVTLLIILLGIATYLSQRTVTLIRQGQLEAATKTSHSALLIVSPLSSLTLHQIPDIELWRLGLSLIAESSQIKTELAHSFLVTDDSTPSITLKSLVSQVISLGQLYEKTWVIKRLTRQYQARIADTTDRLQIIKDTILTGQHNFLVLFQNSQELRATGGFAGSYAAIQLDEGQLTSLDIHDIYQPDGQFVGFVKAPAGVAEFLSSGRGLRLPDANWWPDFPASAQQVLAFFALGKTTTIDGVGAVNLDVVKDILILTGPVSVPDYQTTVTPDNVAEVLRSNREDFFPGSVAKQHLLSSFFTQLKLKIADADAATQTKLLQLLWHQTTIKNIQLYSSQTELQQLLIDASAAGLQQTQLPHQPQPTNFYLYPVESNVGINKANQGINRAMTLTLTELSSTLQINFSNHTQPALDYVNYQRLFVLPDTNITSITFQGQSISQWDEEIITTTSGEPLKQIGFVVTLPAGQTGLLSVELTHPPLGDQPLIVIQKQAGIEPVATEVKYRHATRKLQLAQDTWLQFRETLSSP